MSENNKYKPIIYRLGTLYDEFELKNMLQGIVEAERPMDQSLKDGFIKYYDPMNFVTQDDGCIVVADHDSKLVGCGAITLEKAREYFHYERVGHLKMMYVATEYRGQGINQSIMKHLIEFAKQQDVNDFKLTVYPENTSGIRAYQKLGFYSALVEMRMHL